MKKKKHEKEDQINFEITDTPGNSKVNTRSIKQTWTTFIFNDKYIPLSMNTKQHYLEIH